EAGPCRRIVDRGYPPRYLPSGPIVYALDGNLMAVPFDARRLITTGPPVPLVDGVRSTPAIGEVCFGVSSTGFLVYDPGTTLGRAQRTLWWVDRAGNEEAVPVPPRSYVYPRLSPDGTQVALDIRDQDKDIWIWDLAGRNLRRLTFDPGVDSFPSRRRTADGLSSRPLRNRTRSPVFFTRRRRTVAASRNASPRVRRARHRSPSRPTERG